MPLYIDSVIVFIYRKIHKVSSYFIENEVAHTYLIMRGDQCSSKKLINGYVNEESERFVLRVFLWPRNAVTGESISLKFLQFIPDTKSLLGSDRVAGTVL